MKACFKWILIVCVGAALLFLRSPHTITHPQFWAEDGTFWYADAYNHGGFASTLHSYGGYFQTISRLAAWVSLAVPLHSAPLVFNIIALCIQLFPAILLLSGRFDVLIPDKRIRYVCALLVLVMPNTAEIHGNITNSQWYLALSAFLIVIASAPETKRGKIFDFFVLLLSSLSGPFSLFLFPVAAIAWYARRTRAHLAHVVAIAIGGALQGLSIFILNQAGRLHMAPAFDVKLVFAVFARQIIFGPLLGAKGYVWALAHVPGFTIIVLAITIVALICLVYAAVKASLEIKLALLFGAAIFVVSLLSPTGDFSQTSALVIFSRSSSGIRYWLIPMVASIAAFVWCATRARNKCIKYACGTLLFASVIGVVADFRHANRFEVSLMSAEQELKVAASGDHVVIPITPPGWKMTLIKK